MRKLLLIFLLFVPLGSFSQDLPAKSNRLVNDFSGTLSAQETGQLEKLLVTYSRESSVQISVVMLKSLDGQDISDYAFKLGEKWGIGQSGKNNGALVLVGMKERKVWIATGYGLEATLTDAMCSRIIRNEIRPLFKKNNYYGGLAAGTKAMIEVTRGEYKGKGDNSEQKVPLGILGIMVLMFGIIWIMKAKQVNGYAKRNNLGFLAAWMLLNSTRGGHGGSWSNFSGGGGGFSGGGGFGGFGGGSFGGGGAGGSW